jgi:hypothetical protein
VSAPKPLEAPVTTATRPVSVLLSAAAVAAAFWGYIELLLGLDP